MKTTASQKAWSRLIALVLLSFGAGQVVHSQTGVTLPVRPNISGEGARDVERPFFWGNLPAGPYSVGYSAMWTLDFARRFDITFPNNVTYAHSIKAPRPILINTWYPVSQKSSVMHLKENDYVTIPSGAPPFTGLAELLSQTNRSVISDALSEGRNYSEQQQSSVINRFLKTPVASLGGIQQPSKNRFPLVVYVQGFGSSTEDNSVLCEWLASHGYVVMNSAYQNEKGDMIGGADAVDGDISFIIRYAERLAYVDWRHIALIGHSGGAQRAIAYVSKQASAVDALVSLDTTQDYYAPNFRPYRDYLDDVQPRNISMPLLVVADSEAIFTLTDKCVKAARTYLTIRDLGHEEFISQGAVADLYEDTARAREARKNYEELCAYILAFLDIHLKPTSRGFRTMFDELGTPSFENREINVEIMPTGADSPPPYNSSQDIPPSPRQLRAIIAAQGADSGLLLLKQHWHTGSTNPIYSKRFAFSLVDDLLETKHESDAQAVGHWYEEATGSIKVASSYVMWGKFCLRLHLTDVARQYYERALKFDPHNQEALSGLTSLEHDGETRNLQ